MKQLFLQSGVIDGQMNNFLQKKNVLKYYYFAYVLCIFEF